MTSRWAGQSWERWRRRCTLDSGNVVPAVAWRSWHRLINQAGARGSHRRWRLYRTNIPGVNSVAEEIDERQRHGISRRTFLRGSGAIAATASLTAAGRAWSRAPRTQATRNRHGPPQNEQRTSTTALRRGSADGLTGYQLLTPSEAKTAEALFARILPGTPEDPGARTPASSLFVDYKLGDKRWIRWADVPGRTFAASYEGSAPPEAGRPGAKAIYMAEDTAPTVTASNR